MVTSQKWDDPGQQGEPFCSRSNDADHLSIVHRKNGDNHGGTVVEHPPLFSGISPGDYARISAAARVKEFARGEMLYIEGDSVQQVLLLTSGFAKITQLGLSGTEVILRFSVPGDVLGAVGLFSTGRHCTNGASVPVVPGAGLGCARFQGSGGALPGSAPKHGSNSRRGLAGTRGAIS